MRGRPVAQIRDLLLLRSRAEGPPLGVTRTDRGNRSRLLVPLRLGDHLNSGRHDGGDPETLTALQVHKNEDRDSPTLGILDISNPFFGPAVGSDPTRRTWHGFSARNCEFLRIFQNTLLRAKATDLATCPYLNTK